MNEVLRMNIMNKFAERSGMPTVKLNIYRMCLFVFAPENQLLIAEFGLWAFIVWSEERIRIKSDRVFRPKVVRRLHSAKSGSFSSSEFYLGF